MVTTDWSKFREFKDNGLVKDVFSNKGTMDKLQGGWFVATRGLPQAALKSQDAVPCSNSTERESSPPTCCLNLC